VVLYLAALMLQLPASGPGASALLAAPRAAAGGAGARPGDVATSRSLDVVPHRRESAGQRVADLAPARLVIPEMGLDAPILGLDPAPDGSMQAPVVPSPADPIYGSVYWWDVGAMPGQVGNAVMAGHINRPNGAPASFGNLDVLVPGDQVEVITARGYVLTFVVTAKDAPSVYTRAANDPTIERIFGPAVTPNLNLLTCWGQWNGWTYDRRLTIYTTLVGVSPFPAQ
jgi:hypothetical protein